MAIIISQDHPAFSRLKNQGIAVRADVASSFSQAAGSGKAVTLGFVNLMPTIYLDETVDLLLARLAKAPVDIRPVFINPEDRRKGVSWDEAKKEGLDCVLVTGYAASNLAFEELSFWSGLCRILDDTAAMKLPLFGVCAGAMAIAHHQYGIAKERAPQKLLGNYEYKTAGGQSLFLATSRHNTLNRDDLLRVVAADDLHIAAQTTQTPQPEPAVLLDRKRNVLLALAHLEYGNGESFYPGFEDRKRDILTYQHDRDHAPGVSYDAELAARVKPPVNATLTPAQVAQRELYAEKLLGQWAVVAAACRLARVRNQDRQIVANDQHLPAVQALAAR